MLQNIDVDKIVMLGDLHFGKSKFSKDLLKSQLKFFDEQLYPYMDSNGIKHIIQVGDVFDNRIMMDIEYFELLCQGFFDVVRDRGYQFICIVGNHDIYHKSTREFTILNTISRLYSNVNVINERTRIDINGNSCYFVPWILPNETLTSDELTGVNYVFGHFEIRNFEMTKGHVDEHSMLSPEFFKKKRALKHVFSGHYHIKSVKEKITYLGTPYWLDWGDYNTVRGFFVLDKEFNVEFIENIESKRYIKLKYNDLSDIVLTASGLLIGKDMPIPEDAYSELSAVLKDHHVKLFINESSSNNHEEIIYMLRQQGIVFDITNNVEISNIIGESYISTPGIDHSIPASSRVLIKDTVKKNQPELIPMLEELFRELDEVNL